MNKVIQSHKLNRYTSLLKLSLCLFVGLGFKTSVAQESRAPSPQQLQEEEAIAQKARKRLYPGGLDESDLKVKKQLEKPTRKMNLIQKKLEDESPQPIEEAF